MTLCMCHMSADIAGNKIPTNIRRISDLILFPFRTSLSMDAIATNYSSSDSEETGDDNDAGGADEGTSFEVISVQRAPRKAPQAVPPQSPGTTVPKEDPSLARWVMEALKARATTGVRLEEEVRKNKKFKNPAILEKMIEYCGIEEHASLLRDNQQSLSRSRSDGDKKE